MKKLMLTLVLTLLMCGSAMAEAVSYSHGSTIVPTILTWYKNDTTYNASSIYLSNVTEGAVECTVRFYDHDGNEIGAQANIYTGSQSGGSCVLESTGNTFSIPANASRFVDFYKKSNRMLFGYAVVEWKSSNLKVAKALVGSVRQYGRSGSGTYTSGFMMINNGQPF
ncbi:hypothetical protein [Salidesulfovibrio onnuriiensis]|uniref:hypothetical protein n=1 Tax=Salidesulfovibrio onnuriiensis TaxID=2583823 RepID=UPI0011C922CB|nr:hypothetical protein [Salidesulfovibrio onnuriiensis]